MGGEGTRSTGAEIKASSVMEVTCLSATGTSHPGRPLGGEMLELPQAETSRLEPLRRDSVHSSPDPEPNKWSNC
jgi:hypothetical protein